MSKNQTLRLLRKRKGYARLFAAGLVNGIGDRFSQVAMLSLILMQTGSGMAVGLAMGVRIIPYLLLAPVGGYLAGRFSRKAVLMATDLLRAPVALSFLLVHSERDIWIVYSASFALAAGEAIYAPVRKSSIPLLVRRDELIAVNGLEQVQTGFVLIIGAIAGGVSAVWLGAGFSFALNAVSFLITAGLVARMSFAPVGAEEPGSEAEITDGNEMNESRQDEEDAYRAADAESKDTVKRSRGYRTLIPLFAASLPLQLALGFELLVPLFNGMENVLISVYAVQEYHRGDLGVGLLYGAIGLGLSLSFAAGRFTGTRIMAGALCGLFIEGLLLAAISAVPWFWAAFALYIPLTFAGGFGNACLDTLLMREVPREQQGAVFGFLAATGNSLLGLSMLAGGWLLDKVEPRTVGFTTGTAYVLVAALLAAYLGLRRKVIGRRQQLKPVPVKKTKRAFRKS